MPDPNPIAGLYPQPPQPGAGVPSLLNNPIGTAIGINQMQIMQLERQRLIGQQAAGNALFQGINPQGIFDPSAAVSAARAGPPLGAAGSEFASGVLANRAANTDAASKALGLGMANSASLDAILSPYATRVDASGNPVPISKEDAYNIKTRLAAAGINPATVSAADLNSAIKIGSAAKVAALRSAGVPAAIQPMPGTPTAGGATTTVPAAAALGGGPRVTGNVPGLAPAAEAIGAASGAQAVALTNASDTSPVRKGMLGNLEGDLKQFTSGQGADWQNIAKNWANRNVLPTSLQFDPKSIASQEQFNKQAEQLAQQQFAAIGGTGTDAKFGSAFKANPDDTLSQMGNQGIIRLLKGNEDAIQAKNKAWLDWQAAGHPPQSYPQFAARFNQTFDPRVYQAQYMSKDDLRKMASSMSGPEFQAFKANIAAAKASGYASGPGAQYNGQ